MLDLVSEKEVSFVGKGSQWLAQLAGLNACGTFLSGGRAAFLQFVLALRRRHPNQ
jgi:glutamate/tyrosine decarboxylase-like PLP-dependent enzyme